MNKIEKFLTQFISTDVENNSCYKHTPICKIKARIQYWDFFMVYFHSFFSTQKIAGFDVSRQNIVRSKALKERKVTQDFSIEYIYRNDTEFIETAKEWISVQQQLKNLQEQESQIKNKLLQITQEQPTKCNFLKIFKTHRKGNIDYTQITELKNVDIEKYRKNSTSFWRITYELDRH